MMRVLAHTLLIIGCFTDFSKAQAEVLKIGVRADTPPFASIDYTSGAYEGFFYTVCTLAVKRAGYQLEEVPVTAEERNAFLKTGTGSLDLLCDPTTITLRRMENFAIAKSNGEAADQPAAPHLSYSQIVFVANGGFVEVTSASDTVWQDAVRTTAEGLATRQSMACEEFFKLAEANRPDQIGTQAQTQEENGINGRETPQKTDEPYIVFRFKPEAPPTFAWVLGYVVGSTIGEKVFEFEQENVLAVSCRFPSHFEAAKAFCSGKMHRYYGDIDIIRASIAGYQDMTGEPCEAVVAAVDERTYEPYAFVISSRVPEFKERFVCAIYSMFQDETMDNLFEGYFSEDKSRRLETLFWINSIPPGRRDADISAPFVCGPPK